MITNLLSALPYFGGVLVSWLWGGFAVESPTLTRFFALHFLAPFFVSGFAALHIFYLHAMGSSNPLGVSRRSESVPFH